MLQINAGRLNKRLHETCEHGKAFPYGTEATETGMCRLALTDSDKFARDWFKERMDKMGCRVFHDEMGVQFAIRAGKSDGPPIAFGPVRSVCITEAPAYSISLYFDESCLIGACISGSHLDTQPSGGRYDGILGVHAAIEVMQTIVDNNIETEHSLCVVNWTNEEGARFPKSVLASAVWCGNLPLEEAYNLQDVADPRLTVRKELERIGYLGETPCSFKSNPLAAHFELHIEQGPILEQKGLRVGVVTGGQAYRWFTLELSGISCHTGTTPFESRADALLCAAQMIVASNQIAKKHNGLASTGILTLQPGSVNVCPETVKMSLDIRHFVDEELDKIESEIFSEFERILKEGQAKPLTMKVTTDTISRPVTFHKDCVKAVKDSAIAHVGESQILEMKAGAGHDSYQTNKVCPTAMIFIPSKDGLSHNPKEFSTPEQCADGAQVLLHAVLNYDKLSK